MRKILLSIICALSLGACAVSVAPPPVAYVAPPSVTVLPADVPTVYVPAVYVGTPYAYFWQAGCVQYDVPVGLTVALNNGVLVPAQEAWLAGYTACTGETYYLGVSLAFCVHCFDVRWGWYGPVLGWHREHFEGHAFHHEGNAAFHRNDNVRTHGPEISPQRVAPAVDHRTSAPEVEHRGTAAPAVEQHRQAPERERMPVTRCAHPGRC
jgi:hypothetical protein